MHDLWIILVDYNGAEDTIECVESIVDCNENVNIIVVKNSVCTENDTKLEKIRSFVTFIENKKNGFSAGNNIGIAYALEHNANYILLLNNDTVIDKGFLKKIYEQRSDSSVLTGVMYYYDKPNEIAFCKGEINKYTGNTKLYNFDNHKIQTFISGACMLLSRETLKEVGLLDEDYFMYCEDTDYCIRLLEHNKKLITVFDAKYWHKISRSSQKNSSFINYYVTRNRLLCIKKHKKYFSKTAYFFSVVTRTIRALFSLFNDTKFSLSYFKGIKDGICGETGIKCKNKTLV